MASLALSLHIFYIGNMCAWVSHVKPSRGTRRGCMGLMSYDIVDSLTLIREPLAPSPHEGKL